MHGALQRIPPAAWAIIIKLLQMHNDPVLLKNQHVSFDTTKEKKKKSLTVQISHADWGKHERWLDKLSVQQI